MGGGILQDERRVLSLDLVMRRYHYVKTRLSRQFDAVVYFDQTRAVERLRAS
jgi:erythromycin esterase-like protein